MEKTYLFVEQFGTNGLIDEREDKKSEINDLRRINRLSMPEQFALIYDDLLERSHKVECFEDYCKLIGISSKNKNIDEFEKAERAIHWHFEPKPEFSYYEQKEEAEYREWEKDVKKDWEKTQILYTKEEIQKILKYEQKIRAEFIAAYPIKPGNDRFYLYNMFRYCEADAEMLRERRYQASMKYRKDHDYN